MGRPTYACDFREAATAKVTVPPVENGPALEGLPARPRALGRVLGTMKTNKTAYKRW